MNLFLAWQKSPYFCDNGGVVCQCLCRQFSPLSLVARMGGGGIDPPRGGRVGGGNGDGGGNGGDVAMVVAVALAVVVAVGVGVALRGRSHSHGDYGCSGDGSCGGSCGG